MNRQPQKRQPRRVRPGLKVCLTDGAWRAMLQVRAKAGVSLPPAPSWCNIPTLVRIPAYPAVRGASVRGRVSSVPLKKANWLADRLHSIGRFEGRRQSIPGMWTRWGLSEGQEGEPIRTVAMGGPAGPSSHEGVPKALIRRVLPNARRVG